MSRPFVVGDGLKVYRKVISKANTPEPFTNGLKNFENIVQVVLVTDVLVADAIFWGDKEHQKFQLNSGTTSWPFFISNLSDIWVLSATAGVSLYAYCVLASADFGPITHR